MSINKVIKFFYKEIDFKTWLNVIFNFIFNFLIIISEVLFLSTFFILLNGKTKSEYINVLFQKFEFYFASKIDNIGFTELYLIILIFFLVLKNILILANNIHYNTFIFGLSVKKSSKILTTYINKTYEEFSKKDISIYIKQLVRDVEIVFVGIFGLIITFTSELIYVLILIFFISNLVSFDPSLEIYLIILLMISILYALYVLAKKYGDLRGSTETAVFKTINDTLRIFKEIKIVNSVNQFVKKYNNFHTTYFKTRTISNTINLTPKFLFEFFLIVFFFILFKNESKNLNINEFVIKYSVFAIGLLRLIPSFAKLSSYSSTILYNLKSIDFIQNDLKLLSFLQSKKLFKKNTLKKIRLSKISLNFNEKKNKLIASKINNFNLRLEKNKIYGIYGESGSGKTSLLNVICGFIKPTKGKVFLNNKIYTSSKILRNFRIGYAPQIPAIIDENIIVNSTLKFENSKQMIDKLKFYLNLFNLKKFTKDKFFTNSINSSIKNMSGGEKQRIGIIRALLYEPDLILLDEPTSSLDKINEKKVYEYLRKIKKNKIIVITSHKNENKKYFDKVINL